MSQPPEFNLCDKELASNPNEHTWLEYYNAAIEFAENESNKDSALFCFLLSKIKVVYATHVGEGSVDGDIDQRALLDTIVPAEGGFYRLFADNSERGIQIIDEARRWLDAYAPILAGRKNDGAHAYQAAENDLLYTRNEYLRAGEKFDMIELQNMGIDVPNNLIVKHTGYSAVAGQFFFRFDFNDDGNQDAVYLAQDTRNDTWQVVLEISEGGSWTRHVLPLPSVAEGFEPSIFLDGAVIVVNYTMYVDESSTAAIGGGLMGNSTRLILHSIYDAEPLLTKITADFTKGNFGYSQSIDLQQGVYIRTWTSEFGGSMNEAPSEKLTDLEKSVTVKPILWEAVVKDTLHSVLNLTESD